MAGRRLPATGSAAPLAAAAVTAMGAAAGVSRMSHSEFRLRSATGSSLRGMAVLLVGEVTAQDEDGFTLSRLVPGCCSTEVPVDVRVRSRNSRARVGSWWEVQGRWVEDVAGDVPELAADRLRVMTDPPPRREDLP